MTAKPPLPLEGEGAGGWGEPTDHTAEGAQGVDGHPTSPPEGYSKRQRIKTGGIQRARRLRADLTRAEKHLWERLRRLDVRFRRQAPIGPYVVDFVCHPAKLVVEADGGVHDTLDVALRDVKRDAWLKSEGFRVLRFRNRQIEDDLDGVIAAITLAVSAVRPITPETPSAAKFVRSPLSQPFPPRGERA